MFRYLPSKRFSYILGSIILALLIIWGVKMLSTKQTNQPVKNIPLTTSAQTAIEQFKLLDTDGDKVKDWEEALWKTDSKMADTDGDGTDDGTEIIANRDPLKANIAPASQEPTDKVDEKIIASNKAAEERFNSLTATEKTGQSLFSLYLATRKLDSPLSETEKMAIVNDVITSLPIVNLNLKTEKDLIISDSVDAMALRIYTNDLARIIITNLTTKTETIDVIITNFANTTTSAEAATALARLAPVVTKNRLTIDSLLKISVPKTFTTNHLKILNAFEKIYYDVSTIATAGNDMITMIVPLKQYDVDIQTLSTVLLELRQKLITQKVTFGSENEYGYQLFNVIMLKK